jgi:hypothetical protein
MQVSCFFYLTVSSSPYQTRWLPLAFPIWGSDWSLISFVTHLFSVFCTNLHFVTLVPSTLKIKAVCTLEIKYPLTRQHK